MATGNFIENIMKIRDKSQNIAQRTSNQETSKIRKK